MAKYDHKKIEAKWQKKWIEEKIYEPHLDAPKRPFYNLMMFPYPSAEGLHVGNMYAFTGSDIYGRHQRMKGNDVFEPIGLDGFGIHSENYAMKAGTHPAVQAQISEKHFYEQLRKIGNGFAWEEHLETYDPEYYQWTQWIFVQMWKHGLAYRKKQSVNWCPKDQTVLADEQVENGKCERCGTIVEQKELEQWFFKITEYAERLLKNLDTLDWSEKVKIAQRNWIGKSEGATISFPLTNGQHAIDVFTTRPDTVFGATFIVASPELARQWATMGWEASEEVKVYIEASLAKKEMDRLAEHGEKTGVASGIDAINPATKEKIPVWISDYVLGGYGTGAIMAVPAHDQRDFEFAKKFGLPVKFVIEPTFGEPQGDDTYKKAAFIVLRNPKNNTAVVLDWGSRQERHGGKMPIGGGVEGDESYQAAAEREIVEETGYKNFKFVVESPFYGHGYFYSNTKNKNMHVTGKGLLYDLLDEEKTETKLDDGEKDKFKVTWEPIEKIASMLDDGIHEAYYRYLALNEVYGGKGLLINSNKFDGMDSEAAKRDITQFVGGETKTNYRLRDWLISRQRYWGPPIPMVFCEACANSGKGERVDMPGWYAVPENELPVLLPYVENFRPTGSGAAPLATVETFINVKCPACGGNARRETDVSDTFLDSAWYYLRYLSPQKTDAALDEKRIKEWLPAKMYIGGAEHSVLHLLYVRFVAMALHDTGLIPFEEPFTTFRAHGLVIKDGAKMSKSKGNVINPDDYIKNFGADTLRMYLMFLAPFEDGGDFRDQAILGIARFLERVWDMGNKNFTAGNPATTTLIHKTIKKVEEDIVSLHYNTAVSALMIALRGMEERGVSKSDFELFLKLVAPFAPYLTEELWRGILGHADSIHASSWPVYDLSLTKDDELNLVIQVNGKLRDMIKMPVGISEEDAHAQALASEKVKKHLGDAAPKKIIYVPGKLVNIVTQ